MWRMGFAFYSTPTNVELHIGLEPKKKKKKKIHGCEPGCDLKVMGKMPEAAVFSSLQWHETEKKGQ